MSETVLNAAGTSAAGTVGGAPMRTMNMKWFGYLYIFFGLALLVFGNLFVEYPKAGLRNFTPAASFNTTDAGIISVVGILVLVLGYIDFRNTKTSMSKTYVPAIIFVLGLILVPLFSYYGAFTGLLGNSYNLAGVSMGGLLLVFASLGEIALMRKKKPM